MTFPIKLIYTVTILFQITTRLTVDAAIACIDTTICEELIRPGSECIEGYCSNPFRGGCLRRFLNDTNYKKRICNSHDGNDRDDEFCIEPLFDYPEIRILSQNWESAMFTAWIIQILLSEFLGVPSSIESSGPGRNVNFYDLHNSFSYGAKSYDYDALEKAAEVGSDCTLVTNDDPEKEYQGCAHIMPEVWNGQVSNYVRAEAEGIIEPPEGSGAVGKLGWYIPRFVARKDPTLLSYLGMQGPENRHKVAATFKRPTNWKDYCDLVSENNCTIDDGIAARAPTEAEYDRYHVGGLYKGHFRATEQNDCVKHPKTCTGHITDLPCDWSTFAVAQAYHLKIPVESNGPLGPSGAYTYGNLMDIWAAANETKSPVLYYWWIPDPMYQDYLGTESEFTMVQLPPPSQECVSNRVTPEQRCSDDFKTRVGDRLGSCETESHSLLKLVSSNLYSTLNEVQEETRSPAYEAIKGFTISELQLGQIFDYWYAQTNDHWNYDPREATCRWVVENIYYLETLIPRTYPRVVHEEANYGKVFFTLVFALAIMVTIAVMVIALMVLRYRKSPVIKFAQVGFLYLLLFGLFLVSLGSVMLATEPSITSCVTRVWFVTLGYTFELLPLIVKVAAINRMLQAAKKMKRIKLTQKDLYRTVAVAVTIVTLYLIVWTVVDPPRSKDSLELTSKQTEQHEGEGGRYRHTIIQLKHFCSSNFTLWQYLSVSWQCVLLICATVLAFQTRNLRQDFNESQTMAFMIYSHFVFVCLQLITFLLEDSLQPDTLEACRSLIYSVDAVVAMQVYFVPKLYKAYYGIDVQEIKRRRNSFAGSEITRGTVLSNPRGPASVNTNSLELQALAAMPSEVENGGESGNNGDSEYDGASVTSRWSSLGGAILQRGNSFRRSNTMRSLQPNSSLQRSNSMRSPNTQSGGRSNSLRFPQPSGSLQRNSSCVSKGNNSEDNNATTITTFSNDSNSRVSNDYKLAEKQVVNTSKGGGQGYLLQQNSFGSLEPSSQSVRRNSSCGSKGSNSEDDSKKYATIAATSVCIDSNSRVSDEYNLAEKETAKMLASPSKCGSEFLYSEAGSHLRSIMDSEEITKCVNDAIAGSEYGKTNSKGVIHNPEQFLHEDRHDLEKRREDSQILDHVEDDEEDDDDMMTCNVKDKLTTVQESFHEVSDMFAPENSYSHGCDLERSANSLPISRKSLGDKNLESAEGGNKVQRTTRERYKEMVQDRFQDDERGVVVGEEEEQKNEVEVEIGGVLGEEEEQQNQRNEPWLSDHAKMKYQPYFQPLNQNSVSSIGDSSFD